MAKSKHYYIRRTHRYLGLFLGIQFLVWTISGLYFSWTNLDEIHGDHQRKAVPLLNGNISLVSPSDCFERASLKPDSIHSAQLVSILGKPYYFLQFYSGSQLKNLLADAGTGEVRPAITREESILIASENFNGEPKLKNAEYIQSSHGHHEYRKKPLPAWAVSFEHPSQTTVYVSAEGGKVESFRNDKWRIFDFLWMGHTMDYQGRDNFNNWLLRIFSVFGLVTIISGFTLFWVSRRRKKPHRKYSPGTNV
jgi:hypothetical protein